jgi:hypothetical protein
MHPLIIGGSDASIEAGLRARELAREVEVTLLVADRYPNHSICGIPHHVAGEVADWRDLAHRSRAELDAAGLELQLDHRAVRLDLAVKRMQCVDAAGMPAGMATTNSWWPPARCRYRRSAGWTGWAQVFGQVGRRSPSGSTCWPAPSPTAPASLISATSTGRRVVGAGLLPASAPLTVLGPVSARQREGSKAGVQPGTAPGTRGQGHRRGTPGAAP